MHAYLTAYLTGLPEFVWEGVEEIESIVAVSNAGMENTCYGNEPVTKRLAVGPR